MVLVSELDFWLMHLEVENLLINLTSKSRSLLILNLSLLEHIINEMELMNKDVILCSSVLDGFGNLWEHILDVRVHVQFSALLLLCTLEQDLGYEVLILNYFLDHLGCLLMAFDEVDDDIVRKRKMVEEIGSE